MYKLNDKWEITYFYVLTLSNYLIRMIKMMRAPKARAQNSTIIMDQVLIKILLNYLYIYYKTTKEWEKVSRVPRY